jgi:hypothetical protein
MQTGGSFYSDVNFYPAEELEPYFYPMLKHPRQVIQFQV